MAKQCKKCGTEMPFFNSNEYCTECYKRLEGIYLNENEKEINGISKSPMFDLKVIMCYLASAVSVFMGFYKMFFYDSGYDKVNAYVGGDAYNYIINAGYATAWFVLAIFFAFIGFTFLYFSKNPGDNFTKKPEVKEPELDDKENDSIPIILPHVGMVNRIDNNE